MARIAANQDRSQALRKQYVYKLDIHIVSHKPNGRLLREETADSEVAPTPEGTDKKLTQPKGRYLAKGRYECFRKEPVPAEDSLDASLIKSFRDDLSREMTQDGLVKDVLPLTTEEQTGYQFTLLGCVVEEERDAYHIGFRPNDNDKDNGKDQIPWAGRALIGTAGFEPIRVFTRPAPFPPRSEPCWARTFRAWASTWSRDGKNRACGFRQRLGPSFGFTLCSSSTATFRSRPENATVKVVGPAD